MIKLVKVATPLIAVAMMTGAYVTAPAQSTQSATQDWNTPPAGTEQGAQGWKDGVDAFKLDKAAGRKIDAHTSYLYVHPPVKKGTERDAYLTNFVAGYNAAMAHAG